MTYEEAADATSYSVSFMRKLARTGVIERVGEGKQTRLVRSSVERYIRDVLRQRNAQEG